MFIELTIVGTLFGFTAGLWGQSLRLRAAAPVTPAADDENFEAVSGPRFRDRAVQVEWSLPGTASEL